MIVATATVVPPAKVTARTVGATTTWQGDADTYDVANDVMTFSVWTRIVC
jgi:hypothetical protein